MKSYHLTISPALAKKWLEEKNYSDNRPISKKRVAHYTRQMKNGRWDGSNGEALILDKKGKLLNGQHRLAAIIKSGCTIKMYITEGVNQTSFTTMDQGKLRSGACVMKMSGYDNTSMRSAICRALYVWETTDGSVKNIRGAISPDEILLVQDVYPDEIDAAIEYVKSTNREVPMSIGLIGLGYILLRRAKPIKAKEFLNVFANGLTLERKHPGLVLRKRLITEKIRENRLPNEGQWCAFVRSWNNFDKGLLVTTIPIKRNSSGQWVQQAIRGLGAKKIGGAIKEK